MSESPPIQSPTRDNIKPEIVYSVSESSEPGDRNPSDVVPPKESFGRVVGCFLLMLAAIQMCLGPKIGLSQWTASAQNNAGIAEGTSWLAGRLTLPGDGDPANAETWLHDTAYYDGKAYNVFPPMVSILTVLFSPLHHLLLGRADFWLQTPYTLLFFWPLTIIGFIVFRRRTGDAAWAALLTLAWMGGTALLPTLHRAESGLLGSMNHVMSQVGLLIFAADVLGRQRIWPGMLGLMLATYTRQVTFLYGFALLWLAWKQGRFRKLALSGIGLGIIALPLLGLNYLKFGNPLEFGYRYIYEGRDYGHMAQRFRSHGAFSLAFASDNLYYMHLAPPRFEMNQTAPPLLKISEDNPDGTSLWIITPMAFWVFISLRRWWADSNGRLLMLGTLPIMAVILCYHCPGYQSPGYNRYALDFLPIWLVVIAPHTRGGWRTWLTLGCVAWSMLYFQAIVPIQQLPERTSTARFTHRFDLKPSEGNQKDSSWQPSSQYC